MNPQRKFPSIIGIGAGGHCKVVMEIIHRMGTWKIAGLLDANPARKGELFSGVEILGTDDLISTLLEQGRQTAFVGIGSTVPSSRRQNAFAMLRNLGFELPVLIHPSATVAGDVIIGSATTIMPGAIVNPGARIGECVIINSGSVIEHDCEISAFAHISPGAVLGGSVHVGTGAHVGIGAVVRQGIRIGNHALIGAGAVVIKDVADGSKVMGVPAREF